MISRIGQPDTDADRQLRSCLDNPSLTSFIMVAGAGSGKTTSLVKALAHIAKTRGPELRKRGQKVACITYTDIAVTEISTDVGHDPLFHVSTIHSFLWTVIKPFQRDIRTWVIRRIEEKLAELREKASAFSLRVQQRTREKNKEDILKYEDQLVSTQTVTTFTYGTGSDYPEGILGHDDIIKMVPTLISENRLLKTLIARKYPFVFVDESQDTSPDVVNALKAVDDQMADQFCLGFFGDSMQKIYATGVGKVPPGAGWKEITKPENFRCPTNVLSVINNIRAGGDDLTQTRGRHKLIGGTPQPIEGTARLFIVPADESRSERLRGVREWVARANHDLLWLSDGKDADVRVLVIVHRMAARHLGFPDLYAALNDHVPTGFSEAFSDGTLWAIQPLISFLLPLVKAHEEGQHFEVMRLLRTSCPLMSKETLRVREPAEVLKLIKQLVEGLSEQLAHSGSATVLDVLKFAKETKLAIIDEPLSDYIVELDGTTNPDLTEMGAPDEEEDSTTEKKAVAAYFRCPAKQLWGYLTYIKDESPFWTQQGIKGAEYDRVLTVIDDEEGRHIQFSYNKFFGLVPPSATDKKNVAEGKETVVDRTRRLFYVCCSRAIKDLAVVFFTEDVTATAEKIRSAGIFPLDEIHILTELPALNGPGAPYAG